MEINSENKCENILKNGNAAHALTTEERSRGGSNTKFNNLKHGHYATKISQKFVCPSCGNSLSGEDYVIQREIKEHLNSAEGIIQQIIVNFNDMSNLIELEADSGKKFSMLYKCNQSLFELWNVKQLNDPSIPTITPLDILNHISEETRELKEKYGFEELEKELNKFEVKR